ncbi:MAG: TetR/AcrR family transcriptional regulator [Gulosibacter sp.]|uniref:TetR/AcrR family transcriptional regulator n=1 Tax=Gulosibacter sp. TaxID=2817531 RepID=UPI003F8F175D
MAAPGRPPLDPAQLEPILVAVMDLVATKSSREISYRDVANSAGVSVGKLQHHFGTRDELIRKAFELRLLQVTHALHEIRDQPGTPTQRLTAAADEVALRGAWRRSTIWIDLLHRSVDSSEYRDLVVRVNDSWRNVFTALIRDGISTGEFSLEGPIEDAVQQIIITADGLTVHALVHGREYAKDEAAAIRGIFTRTLHATLGVRV